jgi:hypothetical protein
MLSMNIQFEQWGCKTSSPLCVRSSLSPRYIKIDTRGLVDLLATKQDLADLTLALNLPNWITKGELFGSSSKLLGKTVSKAESFYLNTKIWQHFLKFDTNKHTRGLLETTNGYVFDNSILTDGVGVSVLQVRQDRVGYCCKANNSKALQIAPADVPYLTELELEELEHIRQHTVLVGADPGKSNILYMKDPVSKKSLRYTAQQRAVECRHKKNKRATVAMKQETICPNGRTVEVVEQDIHYNSRTCLLESFKLYIHQRRELEAQVKPVMYNRPTLRKLRFSAHAHTQRSEDKLLHQIVKTFKQPDQEKVTIAWGNWGRREQQRGCIPTPGVGLRCRLARKGKALGLYIARVHEAYTSCTCHACHGRTGYFKNRSYTDKDGNIQTRHVHGLLRCQNKRCSKLWNRDVLGSTNIHEIATAVLEGRDRPLHFTALGHGAHAHQAV